jgi:apolipoprotein N-acyltransferase
LPAPPADRPNRFIALWPLGAAALSGLLLALCYPNWNQGWLVWIALAPLIAAVWFSPPARRPGWRNAGLGYVTGFVFFATTFSWLGEPLASVFQNQWLICLPVLVGAYLALFIMFWAWFIGLFRRGDMTFPSSGRNLGVAALSACAWVAQEWVRSWLFGGFGWNGLGVGLHRNLAMVQIADITGVYGLSFLAAFVNLIAVITVRRLCAEAGRMRMLPHWDFSFVMAAVVGVWGYGVHALWHPVENDRDTFPVRIAAVQPDIPESFLSDQQQVQEIYQRYDKLTRPALAWKPQLLLWPEAAALSDIFDPGLLEYLRGLVADSDSAFILGAFLAPPGDGQYNVAACLTKRGQEIQIYRKMHLVPFGEYIPMRHTFPLFAWIAGDMVPQDMTPGKEYTLFQLDSPPARLGPLICFEDTDGEHTRRFMAQGDKGAQLLVNITNDSWFGDSPGAEQHLANAFFRTIENRRPMVRDSNSGVTCIIDAEGRILHELRNPDGSPFLEGVLFGTVNVPRDGPVTFYTLHGDWVAHAAAAVCIVAVAWLLFRK